MKPSRTMHTSMTTLKATLGISVVFALVLVAILLVFKEGDGLLTEGTVEVAKSFLSFAGTVVMSIAAVGSAGSVAVGGRHWGAKEGSSANGDSSG